jgi:anti-sigma factor RsiW
MNDPLNHPMRETGWRRKLTANEEAELRAWLAAHPDARADWEAEEKLTETLRALPEVPVATNFTARVLQAIQAETAGARPPETSWRWLWRSFLPKAGVAAAIVSISLFTFTAAKRGSLAEKVQSVAAVSEVTSLPDPEVLQDFEVIRQLSATPRPDMELLVLLQ